MGLTVAAQVIQSKAGLYITPILNILKIYYSYVQAVRNVVLDKMPWELSVF